MATAWLDERRPGTVFLARGVGRPLWIGTGREETLLRLDEARARGRRALPRAQAAQAGGRRGQARRDRADGASRRAHERFQPDRDFEETSAPAVRAPHEGAFCLQRLAALAAALACRAAAPSGADGRARLAQALADQELERRPGASAALEHAVDLPLGEHRARPRAARRPSRRTSAGARAAAPARRPAPAPARASPPPPARRSRPRGARSRASRTCASRATSTACGRGAPRCRAPSGCGRAPRPAPAAGSSSSSRVANRRGTSPALRLASFQLPKCSITVCGWTRRLRIRRELAHRRRAAEPLGEALQLARICSSE